MLAQPVADHLRRHEQQWLETLFELLRFRSIANTEPDVCQACAEWLVGELSAMGFTARVVPTPGRPNVIAELHADDAAPTLLAYAHYDVQPPDPLEQWETDPFEPAIRDDCVFARGASDDKGPLVAWLAAADAWRSAGGGLPVSLKLLLEGEEEIGSPNMEAFLGEHGEELTADAAVVSDSEFFAHGVPTLTYSLRGLVYVELHLRGPSADIHSGIHGGAVSNPANGLAKMLAGLHDADGRVTVPGYYDGVRGLEDDERRMWRELPFDEGAYAASVGVDGLGAGERGFTVLERRWARPTLDVNGIYGGYADAGSKTIIPAEAGAKVSMRLVPDQDPEKVVEGFRRYVAENTPPGLTAAVKVYAKARPVLLRRRGPVVDAARAALRGAFDAEPAMVRCGASVPVTEMIQRLLGVDPVLMGFGLPDDRLHSPNERFRLGQFRGGCRAAAAMIGNLGLTGPAESG